MAGFASQVGKRVGVLLLRHHHAGPAVGVVELDEPNSAVAQTWRSSAKRSTLVRVVITTERVCGEIGGPHGVPGVLDDPVEPEELAEARRSMPNRLPLTLPEPAGLRFTRARHGRPVAGCARREGEAEEVMRQRGRLGLLQVGVIGHDRRPVFGDLLQQHVGEADQTLDQPEQAGANGELPSDGGRPRRARPRWTRPASSPSRPGQVGVAVVVEVPDAGIEDQPGWHRVEIQHGAEEPEPTIRIDGAGFDQGGEVAEVGVAEAFEQVRGRQPVPGRRRFRPMRCSARQPIWTRPRGPHPMGGRAGRATSSVTSGRAGSCSSAPTSVSTTRSI